MRGIAERANRRRAQISADKSNVTRADDAAAQGQGARAKGQRPWKDVSVSFVAPSGKSISVNVCHPPEPLSPPPPLLQLAHSLSPVMLLRVLLSYHRHQRADFSIRMDFHHV